MNMKKLLQPKSLIIIGVAVVGGLFMASRFLPKGGKSSASEEEETVIARPILQPYAVDSDPDEYRPADKPNGGSSSPGTVTLPKPQPQPTKPTPQPTPKPQPKPGLPPTQPTKPPVQRSPGQTVPQPQPQPLPGTPRREPTPTPPTTPPVTPNVPGGFPLDCRGVLPRPSDHPGIDPVAFYKRSKNPSHTAGKMLAWAIGGQTTVLTPSKMQAMKKAINNTATWPMINAQRRSRGLKALSELQFKSLQADINRFAVGGRDDFSDATLMHLWNNYHLPFLC